jgi:hypothetical protein
MPTRYWRWMTWTKGERALPAILPETDSVRMWTWGIDVATIFLDDDTRPALWAKDHAGQLHWFDVPGPIVEAIAAQRPKAQARRDKHNADVAAKEAAGEPPTDDYNQPLQEWTTVAE